MQLQLLVVVKFNTLMLVSKYYLYLKLKTSISALNLIALVSASDLKKALI